MLFTATNFLVGDSAISRAIGWIRGTVHSRGLVTSGKAEMAPYMEPRRLTLAEQWTSLSDIIKGATSRAEEATRCHASAAMQLDLAQYALASLVDELSAVMDVGGRRQRATVHVLDVQQPQSPYRFDDAIAA
jgi:hypothetical protein